MKDESILEPVDAYNNKLKDLHHQNVTNYFDELVKKSGIKVEENKITVKKYKDFSNKANLEKNNESKARNIKTLLILLSVVLVIVGIFLIYAGITGGISLPSWCSILIGALSIIVSIIFVVLIKKKINNSIKKAKELKEKLLAQASEQKRQAWGQMKALNELYDWNIASELVEKTVPLIQMDQFFDNKKFEYLHNKYNLHDNNDPNVSTNFIQSGSILGNPFLILNTLNQRMVEHTYTGTLVIHWTTTSTDSKGHRVTHHHSQTLVATLRKPKPDYYYDTRLVYGNDAAPNLSFSRTPSGIKGKSEKEIEKFVEKGAKELEKKADKAVVDGSGFTRLGNDDFDVIFGAKNRDNEVDFRLMFTPLAQKNMLKILKSNEPYGDDFYFIKKKNINYIVSAHSQEFDYYCRPETFINFDYEAAKANFIEYNDNYFKALFADFAPLLSIPLYQQIKPKEYIYKNDMPSNIPSYEHESMANSFSKELLKHPDTATDVILKTSFEKRDGEADQVRIRAHSFKAIPQVDIIPTLGGDGRMHPVPVHWVLYEPIYKDTEMEILNYEADRNYFEKTCQNQDFIKYMNQFSQSNGIIYERGLMSVLVKRDLGSSDIEKIKSYMKKEGE